MSDTVQDRVKRVFENVIQIETFSNDLKMIDLDEWDSLKHINLIMELEREFNIQISFNHITEMISLPKINEVIQKYI